MKYARFSFWHKFRLHILGISGEHYTEKYSFAIIILYSTKFLYCYLEHYFHLYNSYIPTLGACASRFFLSLAPFIDNLSLFSFNSGKEKNHKITRLGKVTTVTCKKKYNTTPFQNSTI